MSEYLIRLIRTARNVDVRFRVEVVGGGGSGRLEHVELRDRTTGKVERTAAAGLFVLIGAAPHTDWLEGAVERDEWGYVITGTEGRALLETTMSGVFAVGDVRAGSVKRVASAVGEGSIAVRLVHDYLAGNS
jgi:thioredoxin reductase (NADPH)